MRKETTLSYSVLLFVKYEIVLNGEFELHSLFRVSAGRFRPVAIFLQASLLAKHALILFS